MSAEDEKYLDEETVKELGSLNNQLSPAQFEQAVLYLHCIGLDDLEETREVLDLYTVFSNSMFCNLALPLVQVIVNDVGVYVPALSTLNSNPEEYLAAKNILAFPTLLIDICRKLGKNDFHSFRSSICAAVLHCNPKTIGSCAELMKKLIQQTKISVNDVTILKKWLKSIHRDDLETRVGEYEKKIKALHDVTSSQEACHSQDSDDSSEMVCMRHKGSAMIWIRLKDAVASLAQQLKMSVKSLDLPIPSSDIQEIAKLFEEGCDECTWLSAEAKNPLDALQKWSSEKKEKATYRPIVEDLLRKSKLHQAETVCRYAKQNFFHCSGCQPRCATLTSEHYEPPSHSDEQPPFAASTTDNSGEKLVCVTSTTGYMGHASCSGALPNN